MQSENAIPADPQAAPYVRSASAAGYLGNSVNGMSKSLENIRGVSAVTPPAKPSPPRVVALEPLSEDDTPHEFERSRASTRPGYEDGYRTSSRSATRYEDGHRTGSRSGSRSGNHDGYLSPTGEHRDMSRSSSSLQMRDLQDQMHDLKGRLSVLRDRARDDAMRRRSMQSLRTPSPFTVAENWYTEAPAYANGGLSQDAGVGHPAWNKTAGGTVEQKQLEDAEHAVTAAAGVEEPDHILEHGDSDAASVYEDVRENQPVESLSPDDTADEQHVQSEVVHQETYDTAAEEGSGEVEGELQTDYNESVNGQEDDGYESESGASMYHDAFQEQVSHEDREDAFDYEHFFLHSAMGTISREKLERRGSTGSYDSDASVETTRGPVAYTSPKDERPDTRSARGHTREGSKESISTLATFATATEGRGSVIWQNGEHDNHAVYHPTSATLSRRSSASLTPKRATFDPLVHGSGASGRASAPPGDWNGSRMHRPSMASVNSFGSAGTARSFPLVNKAKSQGDLKTTGVNSAGQDRDFRNDPLVAGNLFIGTDSQPSPVSTLAKEDQILVERIVASLGQCVLGMSEAGRASAEGRAWRRRLDAARRVLDGQEGAV